MASVATKSLVILEPWSRALLQFTFAMTITDSKTIQVTLSNSFHVTTTKITGDCSSIDHTNSGLMHCALTSLTMVDCQMCPCLCWQMRTAYL